MSNSSFQPLLDPVGQSAALSALAAASPLIVLFLLLGAIRMKAHLAGLIALGCAIAVATLGFGMPLFTALNSIAAGAAFGLFPIMWIVVNAIWIYNMTVATGHFEVLRRSICSVSPDLRVQAVVIAFCFGGLLEALAGFGTPVAISAAMLIPPAPQPMKAAAAALVANTAPVAFGAMAAPITTLAALTQQPEHEVSMMVGRQTPVLALVVPLVLALIVDGRRGVRQTWPAAILVGIVFAVTQFAAANYLSAQLTDVVAALAATAALVVLLRYWQPSQVMSAENSQQGRNDMSLRSAVRLAHRVETGASGNHSPTSVDTPDPGDSRKEVLRAYAPYLVIIAVFSVTQFAPLKEALARTTITFDWPGLDVLTVEGTPSSSASFTFDWLASSGTLLLLCGVVVMPLLHLAPGRAVRAYWHTLVQLRTAILTVAFVLGLPPAIGYWLAGAGSAFALLSPVLGWLGVAVTGSDTSANALFGSMQATVATQTGADPLLYTSANTSGGVIGKMISPQNLAIAAGVTGLTGREGDLLRKVVGWSLLFLVAMSALVYLQSGPALGWMVP
nr:L-lactate permease [Nocardiopsis salina]